MADGLIRGLRIEGVAPSVGATVSRLIISIACLFFFTLGYAEELLDPTRPPVSLAVPVPASGVAATPPTGLQSIIISKTRRTAIIDGESVELGSNYGDAKLIEVNEGSVILQSKQGRQVLTLFPDVMITGKQGIKIRPQRPAGEVRSGTQRSGSVARKEER